VSCQCANVPVNVRVIRVGESDIGLVDLNAIIKEVFFGKSEMRPHSRRNCSERSARRIG